MQMVSWILVAAMGLAATAGAQFVDFDLRATPIPSASATATGDFDGDGDQDLLVLDNDNPRLVWMVPNENGRLGAPVASPVGLAQFGGSAGLLPGGLGDLAVGDVDGDLDLDFVVFGLTAAQYFLGVGLNDGSGHFSMTFNPWHSLNGPTDFALGDADGDGDLDVFILDRFASGSNAVGGSVHVYVNDGAGVMTLHGSFPAQDPSLLGSSVLNTTQADIVAADFDGDSVADCAVANGRKLVLQFPASPPFLNQESNTVTVLQNDGTGSLSISATLQTGSERAVDLAAADLDGDLSPDLAVASFGIVPNVDGDVTVFLNDGAGGFPSSSLHAAAFHPTSVDVADVDGDMDPDLVARADDQPFFTHGFTNALVATLANDGSGGFGAATLTVIPHELRLSVAGAADFDADGADDVALIQPPRIATLLTSPSSLPTYPGSGEDFVMASGINGNVSSTPPNDVFVAPVGSTLTIQVASPGGTFVGELVQAFATDVDPTFPPLPLFGFPDVYLHPFANTLTIANGLLPAAGFTGNIQLPFWLAGRTWLFQAFALSPIAANGAYAATDAHQVTIM